MHGEQDMLAISGDDGNADTKRPSSASSPTPRMKLRKTQVWIPFAHECGYLQCKQAAAMYQEYHAVIGMLLTMIHKPDDWLPK